MPVRIFTIPFNEETGLFNDDHVQQFLLNKRVLRMDTKFFSQAGRPYWTLAIQYDTILKGDPEDGKPGERGIFRRRERGEPEEERGLDEQQRVLYLKLKEWRAQTAQKEGRPIFMVAKNRELSDIVRIRCQTLESLQMVKGWRGTKIEKYGKEVVAMVQAFYQVP